jgi:CubicO group peptidase (beta-lactamase class C family)
MKQKSFRLLISVVVLLFCFVAIQAQDTNAKFDEYLTAITKQGRFTGSVLVAREGQVIFSKSYGMANLEFDIPNTPQTKFRLGSITKQFTSAAILLLQERGKLSVQDPVCKYVENCPKTWEPVTIHHLLTHTSGIPSYTNAKEYRAMSTQPVTPAAFVDSFKSKPLDFAVGEKYQYNNSGYYMLGYLIEKISGQSYEAFLQDNIFTPLKMANTGYDTHDRILKLRATGYEDRAGKPINSSYVDMSIPYAAGSLYSTTEDLFVWNEALFSDKLLTAKSRAAMMTPDKNNYGYGVVMNQQYNRARVSHGGGINGFNTYLTRFPAEKITIIALRNSNFGVSPDKVCADFAAILFGEKYEIPGTQVVAKVDPKIYDAYVGEYQLAPNFILTVTREGDRLMTQATGQGKIEIFPESETKFFPKVMEAKITFVKDESGKVTHLILQQGGERQAKKIK